MTTQIIDGLECNAAGYPLAAEYAYLYRALDGSGVTGISPDGWAGAVAVADADLSRRNPCPVHWLVMDAPGPVWVGQDDGFRWYSFFAPLHCQEMSAGTPLGPSWRLVPHGPPGQPNQYPADLADRTAIASTWPLWRDLASKHTLKYLQYAGRLDDPDSCALAESNPTAWLARAERAYDFYRYTIRADAIAIDASNYYGSNNRPPHVSAAAKAVFEAFVATIVARAKNDPTAPMVLPEPWVETGVLGSTPRANNTVWGPEAGQTFGVGCYTTLNDAVNQVPAFGGAPDAWQAPHGSHRVFVVDYIGVGSAATTPATIRASVNAGNGAVFGINQYSYANTVDLLPPRAALKTPFDKRHAPSVSPHLSPRGGARRR
ncbi:MAG: hypothetical protein ACRCT8_12045 [Lacipirellulaceae bacterium]